ncbi:MAG: PQQ-binding-like beta-propeller repeat protein [Gammaproteobacteria bacterium]|nr:PQQ-binding-like beta-propeller repeat protein [Gammaproteobacteria bacterium]
MITFKRPLVAIALAAPVLLLGACGNKSPHEPSDLVDVQQKVALDEMWSVYLSANGKWQYGLYAPYVDGDDLYTVTQSGYLYKYTLDGDEPDLQFRVNLGEDVSSGVTVHEERAYVCAGSNQLIAYSVEDGSEVEAIDLTINCVAPPVFSDNRIYVRLADGTVVALDEARTVLWSHSQGLVNLSLDGASPLLLYNDSLYFGTDTSRLVSLSPAQGDLYWTVNVGTPKSYTEIGLILDIDAPMVIWGNYLIVSAYQSRILMINSLTGRQIWELDLSTRTGVFVDDEDERAWIADNEGVVHGIELDTGNILWSTDTLKYRTVSRPVKIDNYIIVADRFGYLHIFTANEGFYVGRQRNRVLRTERDPKTKRNLRGRYKPKHKQTQLTLINEDILVTQDLSGRLVYYQLDTSNNIASTNDDTAAEAEAEADADDTDADDADDTAIDN